MMNIIELLNANELHMEQLLRARLSELGLAPNVLLILKGQGITIQPLQSVMAFFEEGQAMHHCVFTRAYYKDKGSLILSARDSKGNRIETIELDIKSGRVNQSRGKFNKLTDYHDTIVRLVETNAIKFQKARRKPIHQSTSQQVTA